MSTDYDRGRENGRAGLILELRDIRDTFQIVYDVANKHNLTDARKHASFMVEVMNGVLDMVDVPPLKTVEVFRSAVIVDDADPNEVITVFNHNLASEGGDEA